MNGHGGVDIDDTPGGIRPISGVSTGLALFAGWTPHGPLDRAVQLASVADLARELGGLDTRSLVGYAVRHFFENGGRDARVVRITGDDTGRAIDPADASFHAALLDWFAGVITAIDLFNLVCVPGLTDLGTIAALQRHCRDRRAFLILDGGEMQTIEAVLAALPALAGPDAMNSALYFPWVMAPDPLQGGAMRAFPPSGFVAGFMARTDAERGVWKAPAGDAATLRGAAGLAARVSDADSARLNPSGVNCLRTRPGLGTVVWGSRTLHGNDARASEWKYIPVRRLALFLQESIERGTRWAVFETNDESLWAQLRQQVGTFLNDLFRQGAFQGSTGRDAFFVKCDRETTTAHDINSGHVNIIVGFAPLKPAEFVVLTVRQTVAR